MNVKKALLILLINLTASVCFSQEKRTYQTGFTNNPPSIDGLMNDPCWDIVEWSGDFIQTHPEENKAPTQQTAFKLLYDYANIYIFIRAYDSEPGKISSIMSRRDSFDGDLVFVDIDSYFDKQTAFSFAAMASGAKGDIAITQNGDSEDDSWNPVWYLKTSIDDKGWCAEMKIPVSQLRFGNSEDLTWGLQVSRVLYRNQERSLWQFIPKGSPGVVHLYGEIHGIKNLNSHRQVELMPYAVARAERFEKIDGDPFNTGKLQKFSAGLDGKIGISNDFTLDFTVNPDFGQVEADPSEVNLTAFETYFSERRPFFIEGRNIFEFQPNQTIVIHNMYSDNLFYSRRIGRYPHNSPTLAENEYARIPEATTIMGAVKLSGKTKNGLSIGILESLAAKENAVIDNEGLRRKETVEPLTNYLVGRVQKDFNKGETVLGGMITAVNRDINTPLLNYLHKSAYVGGIDFQHKWNERTWYVAGNAEFSNVNGDREAITDTQTSSARYFQRPDAGHLSVDSSLTKLSGYGATVKLGKSSKKRLQFETSITLRSPGLEFNDIGYMRYSDIIHQGVWVAYYLRNPFSIFNNFYLNTNHWAYWNFDGQFLSSNININFNSQFKNRWRLNGQFNRQSENRSVSLLRGGPSFLMPGNNNFNLNLHTDQSKKISGGIGTFQGKGDAGSSVDHSYWTYITVRPSNSISLSVEPEYDDSDRELQYINTISSGNTQEYLFGSLRQKTLSATLRFNYTINPELSIEYYCQPFVSAGKYGSFKKIVQPDAGKFRDRFHSFTPGEISYDETTNVFNVTNDSGSYSFDNPDFNFRQFRSNLVVRWEYRPGSVLYLVWSQGRTSSGTNGSFRYGDEMKNLFDETPHDVFLLKFSYWFSL
ncbi:MAG TPA: DUF5916 domain-containing protein [Bacteroidales bacterium]|nr:DUF5916 domain-containing protein [Bacteroidales bacterium]